MISKKDIKKAKTLNSPADVGSRAVKKDMAKKMSKKELKVLKSGYQKDFGKKMPKHLEKDYPNIK